MCAHLLCIRNSLSSCPYKGMRSAAGSEQGAGESVGDQWGVCVCVWQDLVKEKIDCSICLKICPAADPHSGDFGWPTVT